MNIIWVVIQILIGIHLLLPLLLYIIYSVKKNAVSRNSGQPAGSADYAVIVTAYEQTTLLPAVVKSLLTLNYNNFLIYVVADKCDISDLHFDDERVILLRPEETLASNTRSHFYAINHFRRQHERLTIIDSDNLVHPEYLNELNVFFDRGFEAVQGVRNPKNLTTTYACLDAARDIYYHFYDGKMLFALGSSATLAGSGMAFTTLLYRNCLEHLDIRGAGFDKVLQAEILKRNKRIAFAPKAIVFDEKTSKPDQLVNQRSRWINTWFKYFKYGFVLLSKGIRNLSINQFLFGITLLRPPIFLFLLSSLICLAINLWISPYVSLIWAFSFLCFLSGFIIALKKSETDKKIYQSLSGIPAFMFYQVISLTRIRGANKRSVATRHFYAGDVQQEGKEK